MKRHQKLWYDFFTNEKVPGTYKGSFLFQRIRRRFLDLAPMIKFFLSDRF